MPSEQQLCTAWQSQEGALANCHLRLSQAAGARTECRVICWQPSIWVRTASTLVVLACWTVDYKSPGPPEAAGSSGRRGWMNASVWSEESMQRGSIARTVCRTIAGFLPGMRCASRDLYPARRQQCPGLSRSARALQHPIDYLGAGGGALDSSRRCSAHPAPGRRYWSSISVVAALSSSSVSASRRWH